MSQHQVLSTTGSKKPRFFYGYIIVVVVFFIMVVMYGVMYTFGVFFKPLITEFGWTRATTSGAYTLYFFMQGLFYIVAGRLNDRFGPRLVVTVSGFLIGLGYSLMSQISAIWQLYLFYGVIAGIGLGGGFVPLASTVARWFVKRRGLMTGIVVSGIGIGTVIMPPIASRLIASYGWSTSYLIMGVISLVLIILAAQFLKRDPGQIGQLPDGEREVKKESLHLDTRGFSLREAIRTRQLWMVCATFFFFGFSQQIILVHIVPHVTDLGVSDITAANILAATGGPTAAGMIGMGSVADRIGSKLIMVIGFVILIVAFLLLMPAREIWMLYLFAVIFGFGYGGLLAVESPIVADVFGLRAHGVLLGIAMSALMVGGGIGPFVAGRIFDLTTSYQLAFLVCTILSVIALILISLLKSPRRREGLIGNV
ncbi:L-lactate transporter [subsurface metagenome]